MARIVYIGPHDTVEVPALIPWGLAFFTRGVPVEVPDSAAFGDPAREAGGLLDQIDNWALAPDDTEDQPTSPEEGSA